MDVTNGLTQCFLLKEISQHKSKFPDEFNKKKRDKYDKGDHMITVGTCWEEFFPL